MTYIMLSSDKRRSLTIYAISSLLIIVLSIVILSMSAKDLHNLDIGMRGYPYVPVWGYTIILAFYALFYYYAMYRSNHWMLQGFMVISVIALFSYIIAGIVQGFLKSKKPIHEQIYEPSELISNIAGIAVFALLYYTFTRD